MAIRYRTVRALNPSFDPRECVPSREGNPPPSRVEDDGPEESSRRARNAARRLAQGEHR